MSFILRRCLDQCNHWGFLQNCFTLHIFIWQLLQFPFQYLWTSGWEFLQEYWGFIYIPSMGTFTFYLYMESLAFVPKCFSSNVILSYITKLTLRFHSGSDKSWRIHFLSNLVNLFTHFLKLFFCQFCNTCLLKFLESSSYGFVANKDSFTNLTGWAWQIMNFSCN